MQSQIVTIQTHTHKAETNDEQNKNDYLTFKIVIKSLRNSWQQHFNIQISSNIHNMYCTMFDSRTPNII